MKKILTIIFTLISLLSFSQENFQAKNITAIQKLSVGTYGITAIDNDSSMSLNSPYRIPTQYSVYNLVSNRIKNFVTLQQLSDSLSGFIRVGQGGGGSGDLYFSKTGNLVFLISQTDSLSVNDFLNTGGFTSNGIRQDASSSNFVVKNHDTVNISSRSVVAIGGQHKTILNADDSVDVRSGNSLIEFSQGFSIFGSSTKSFYGYISGSDTIGLNINPSIASLNSQLLVNKISLGIDPNVDDTSRLFNLKMPYLQGIGAYSYWDDPFNFRIGAYKKSGFIITYMKNTIGNNGNIDYDYNKPHIDLTDTLGNTIVDISGAGIDLGLYAQFSGALFKASGYKSTGYTIHSSANYEQGGQDHDMYNYEGSYFDLGNGPSWLTRSYWWSTINTFTIGGPKNNIKITPSLGITINSNYTPVNNPVSTNPDATYLPQPTVLQFPNDYHYLFFGMPVVTKLAMNVWVGQHVLDYSIGTDGTLISGGFNGEMAYYSDLDRVIVAGYKGIQPLTLEGYSKFKTYTTGGGGGIFINTVQQVLSFRQPSNTIYDLDNPTADSTFYIKLVDWRQGAGDFRIVINNKTGVPIYIRFSGASSSTDLSRWKWTTTKDTTLEVGEYKVYTINSIDTVNGNIYVSAKSMLHKEIQSSHNYFSPTDGQTVYLANNSLNIINPGTSLSSLNLVLPQNPSENDFVEIKIEKPISSLSYTSSSSVSGGPLSISSFIFYKMIYDSSSNTWQ